MEQYIIIKQFIFKEKVYFKDKFLTANDVGEKLILRLIKGKYIKRIGQAEDAQDNEGPGNVDPGSEWYLETEDFLSAEELAALEKPQLAKYATHIGLTFKGNIGRDALRKLINEFIEKALSEQDNEGPGNVDPGNGQSGENSNAEGAGNNNGGE